MRAGTLLGAAVLLLFVPALLLVPAVPAGAQTNARTITGVVLDVYSAQELFLLQELGLGGSGPVWTVRVSASTEGRRPPDLVGKGAQPALRLLRTGDIVEVQGWALGGTQVLATAVTVRASAEAGRGAERIGEEIRLLGVIVELLPAGQDVISIQQFRAPQPWRWTVRLHSRTKVEGREGNRDFRRDLEEGHGRRAAFRLLQVGDLVEVEGRVIASGWIQADEIVFRGHPGVGASGVSTPAPFPPGPFPMQVVILSPQPGATITSDAFSVVGQTVPGAQVRVEVGAQLGFFRVPVTSGTVTADQFGIFVFAVHPALRIAGTTYTITVTSTFRGLISLPVTITVRQT